jgi:two-component system nitrate/nitrite response regulator NarL
VLANHFEIAEMMSSLDAGAHGYCLSTIGCDALVKSLELVMLGETVFPSALFLSNLGSFSRNREAVEAPIRVTRPTPSDRQARNLSSREAEILRCLMQGAPNKVIARELDVAEATVKVHVKAILRKIQVSNRTQAAIWATEHMSQDEPTQLAR